MSLLIYNRKRKFGQTPEPKGKKDSRGRGDLRFVVQMHDATRLHWDLRLEFDGVYKSWAVPKGPSLNPLDQRLAVFVEDHPIEYGTFEGIIPKGNYGAGTVMLWDEGHYIERGSTGRTDSEEAMKKAFEKGHITFVMKGKKLNGEFALIKLKKTEDQKAWLLVKKRDEFSTFKRSQVPNNLSVKTGRSIDEIAEQSEAKGNVWLSRRPFEIKNPVLKENSPERKEKPSKIKTTLKPKAVEPVATAKTKSEPMPRKIKPMLPTLGKASLGKNWTKEALPDGLRAIAEVEGKKVRLYSKSGLPFEKKFPAVVEELRKLDITAVLDGQITKPKNHYAVLDVLYHDGYDLRKEALADRLEVLSKLIPKQSVVFPVEKAKSSDEIFLSRNPESLYHSGTTTDWQIREQQGESGKATVGAGLEDLRLTNLDKIFWPNEGYTKGDVIEYYEKISEYILPFLKNRPQSLNRQPNGIAAPGFYQKDLTGYKPKWLKTKRIFSESADKSIDYVLCQDQRSLLYIANLGCIEINPWFSTAEHLDKPDFLVIDLDPDNNPFDHVMQIAHEVHEILDEVGAKSFVKTSGATGIHIGIPTAAKYTFDEGRDFTEIVCRIIAKRHPATTSVERNPQRRRKKIYMDYMQNRRGQTLAAPFCIRPKPEAPVSMPLDWKELKPGLRPEKFNIQNAVAIIPKQIKYWEGVLGPAIDLAQCLKTLQKEFKL